MDHKLENLKADFKRSIPTSFTEQDKQAVMQKIKKPKLDRGPSFLPKTLSFIAFAVACLFFIVFIFSSDSDLFNLSREDSAYNSNEETAAMNGNDAADDVNEPDIIGYVMEVEENQILVVASEPITTAGSNEFYDAMYFSNVQEDAQVGDFVQAWTDGGAADSYPGQAALGHLEVIEVEQREGAKLTEAEAIQRAIDYGKETNQIANHVIAIRSIDFDRYNQENAVWSFEFYDTMEENVFHIEIQDQHPNEVTLSPYDTYLNPIMSAPFDPETIGTDEVISSFTVTEQKK